MTENAPDIAPAVAEDTRTRLLDAAEQLFAERGIEGSSLRMITERAEANLAAVNYHFGNKEGLVLQVLRRRVEPMNRERLELLELCTESGAIGKPAIECIIHAFVAPPLRIVKQERGGHDIARIIGRTLSEPGEEKQRLFLSEFREVIDRFTAAIGDALPELDQEEVYWRFLFMVGAMVHAAGRGFLLKEYSGGLCDPVDLDTTIQRLVSFLTAGMSTPPLESTEEDK